MPPFRIVLLSLYFSLIFIPASFAQSKPNQPPTGCTSEQLVMATLWTQISGEYQALCYQAYNLARWKLDGIAGKQADKPLAIVADVDETLLDNSAFEAMLVTTGREYTSELWQEWVFSEKASAVPGAVEFAKHAHSLGIPILLVTNRKEEEKEATFRNLARLGFPAFEESHCHFKAGESGKEIRRNRIRDEFEVVMFLGDNLNDFDQIFEDRTESVSRQAVASRREWFGDRFIVFPNPMYGDWENPVKALTKEAGSPCQARKKMLISE